MFDEYAAPFQFQNPKKIPAAPMITFDNVSVGYGDKVVLRHITNRIDPDDRIALVGVNGNGKSTFAKLLAGDLKPMGGEMRRSKGLEIAYFAQHQMDKLKPEQTPLEHVIDLMPYDSEAKRRSRASRRWGSPPRAWTRWSRTSRAASGRGCCSGSSPSAGRAC